jgi:transposase
MQPVSCAGCQALQRRLRDLQAENERLRRQLDEATRARRRQAAPFPKGQPTDQPKKPGRKPGREYGPKAHRQTPRPEQIDEVHEAPLPNRCPDCGGTLDQTHIAQQFQFEIPLKPIHRQFNIHTRPQVRDGSTGSPDDRPASASAGGLRLAAPLLASDQRLAEPGKA